MPRDVRFAASIQRLTRGVLVLAGMAMLIGCAATGALKRPEFNPPPAAGTKLLVMTPDVQLSELTAAGLEEPNAQWTALGRRNVLDALSRFMDSRGVAVVAYRDPPAGTDSEHAHVQLLKLHEAVGGTILTHKYNQAAALPTKAKAFDWTLGPGVGVLGEAFDADYALFIHLHDSYASGGRVAMMVAMAAFGVAVPGGVQRGFASLVNLGNGDVVWFNVLVRGTGDLRTPESAADAVGALLAEVPF